MNNPDLYAAWLTAGNNLHQAAGWIATNWHNLTAAGALALFGAWCIRRALRDASSQVDAILADLDNHPRKESQ